MISNLQIINKFSIPNKKGKVVPFRLNRAQRFYYIKKSRRDLVLKARQGGLSKIIDADQLADCLKKPTNAVVISHEAEATKRLFASVRGYVESLEVKPVTSMDSQTGMRFEKVGSSYYVGTAGSKTFGRGDTLHRAHLSEAAFYPNLEQILAGISEACEYGEIVLETTPNGKNAFYNMWQEAKRGDSVYNCIFIPWFLMDYASDKLTAEEIDGLSAKAQEILNEPRETIIYTDEEVSLIKRAAREYKTIITPEQIKWRRYKILDKKRLFFQEYPEDDVSCFLVNEGDVFGNISLDESLRVPMNNMRSWSAVKNLDEEEQNNTIIKYREKYLFAGIDCAAGKDIKAGSDDSNSDAHCFTVFDPMHPDIRKGAFIFEYHSKGRISDFYDAIEPILKGFNICVGVESNGVGVAHIEELKRRGIPFVDWNTSGSSRPVLINDLEEAYRKDEIIETYAEAIEEASAMRYVNERAEHPKSGHDDRVFSRAIAFQMYKTPAYKITNL